MNKSKRNYELEKQKKSEGHKVDNCHPVVQPPNGTMWSNEYTKSQWKLMSVAACLNLTCFTNKIYRKTLRKSCFSSEKMKQTPWSFILNRK